jgi:hypothetical protein
LAFVSHHWPSITWENVERMPAHWWAYYVRAAQAYVDSAKQQGEG